MKIFISWSGKVSHKIACIFRDWLPSVIQSVKPYVSSEDIDKGTRWSSDIAGELEVANYGIIIITKENLKAEWINFEAGALSKSLDKANVSPFLFNIKRSEVQGPLLQFQSTIFEKSEVHKLLGSINKRLEDDKKLSDSQLDKSFDIWWNDLEYNLKAVEDESSEESETNRKDNENNQSQILEEILELVRSQQRMLNSQEGFLTKQEFNKIINGIDSNQLNFVQNLLKKHRRLEVYSVRLKRSIEMALLENNEDKISDVEAEINIILSEIEYIGELIRQFERTKYAEIRNQRIIPEF